MKILLAIAASPSGSLLLKGTAALDSCMSVLRVCGCKEMQK